MHMFQQPRPTPKCFGGNTVKALSITQIVCGALAILLGIAIIIPGSGLFMTGYPIWTGAMFLSTGIIGIFAAKRKTKCMIIPLMVLSILSSILSGTVTLVLAAIAIPTDAWGWCWNFPDCPAGATVTIDVLLILLALLELGLAISTSVMTCYAICPGCTEGSTDSCTCCDTCNNSGYQAPAVAYQVGADGRLVQMPGQYAMQGGQPIAMTPFPASQPQHVTALPAGAMSQQPLLVTQTPAYTAAAQGNVGAGQGPKPQGNVVFVPVQNVTPAPRQHQVAQPMSTGGHGNIQYVIAAGTPIPQAAGQQQPQSVPQVQFQQPSQAVPYPHPAQLQPQQQPNVPQGQVSAPPTGSSPPPSYQPAEPDSRVAANQAMPTEEDDAPLIED
ncbi:MS4A4A [Branchiostoma lanceolatum]|uniref:MS4A4A protein n=1 Tax=Branchiostoma lanceolatum TaxID=7740 RepID=A0A8J9ZHV9_BRALA|nr:MS4A4A [Branchiostoma lanceolatum]